MDSHYAAGVSARADYLTNLPARARNMWVDAAYEVWLQARLEPVGGIREGAVRSGTPHLSREAMADRP